jgi:hypothetical protein
MTGGREEGRKGGREEGRRILIVFSLILILFLILLPSSLSPVNPSSPVLPFSC